MLSSISYGKKQTKMNTWVSKYNSFAKPHENKDTVVTFNAATLPSQMENLPFIQTPIRNSTEENGKRQSVKFLVDSGAQRFCINKKRLRFD